MKKRKYFYQYYNKIIKLIYINKLNQEKFHNRLFNESKKREKLLSELEQKFYKSEEEICTFSPKINNYKNIYRKSNIYFLKEINKIKTQEPIFNDPPINKIMKTHSCNKNNGITNGANSTESIKVLKKLLNTNSFFYPCAYKNQPNEIGPKNINIKGRNSFRVFKNSNNFHENKENISLNYNRLFNNQKNNYPKSNFILHTLNNNKKIINDNQYYYDFDIPNGNNIYKRRKSISYNNTYTYNNTCNNTLKRKLNNNDYNKNGIKNLYNKKISNIEIDNNNKDNCFIKFNNYIELNKRNQKNKIINNKNNKNKIGIKNEQLSLNNKKCVSINTSGNILKKNKSNNSLNNKKCVSINTSGNILKKNKSNKILNKSQNQKKLIINLNKEGMDYFKSKMNSNKNKNKNNISKKNYKEENDNNNTFNDIIKNEDIENSKNKIKLFTLKKYNSYLKTDYTNSKFVGFNSFKKNNLYNKKDKNKDNVKKKFKEMDDKVKNFIISKKNKSLDSKHINSNISNSFGNNSFIDHKKSILNGNKEYSINDLDNNLNNIINNNKINKLPKIEYFYTFRNKKIQYNSFNYISNSKSNTNKNIDNNKLNSNNYLNDNSKTSIKNNNVGIFILEKSNSKANIKNTYYLNNRINEIYSNNYDKNKYIINKLNYTKNEKNNKNNKNSKPKSNKISYTKISRPSINTNNTNNETKGYSTSTLSVKENKTNSKRESKNNISIQNKIENFSKYIPDNKNNINNSNLRKYINNFKIRNDNKNINNINKTNYNNKIHNKDDNLKVTSKVAEECFNNYKKKKNEYIIKNEKSMTLQSLSDSKMLELAEHYINNKDDYFEDIGIKKVIFKKKNNNENKDITFSN